MSPRAAWRLEALGFTDIYDYVAGKADWTAAGLPIEGRDGRDAFPPHVTTRVVTADPEDLLGHALVRAGTTGDPIVVVNPARVVLGRIRPSTVTSADANERVRDVMHEGPATVRLDEDPHDLFRRMRDRDVLDVLVTDPDGRLAGLIRRADLEATDLS